LLRLLLRILLVFMLALLVLAGGLFAYAQTGPGRAHIARLAEAELSAPGAETEIDGLSGLIPFDVRIGRLRVSDAQGAWLEAEEVRVRLSPTALVRGAVVVEEAGAKRVALPRLPPAGEGKETGGLGLPDGIGLPETLPVARIERLAVDRIELGTPVLGTPAVLTLEGRGGVFDDGRTATAELHLRRLDAAGLQADLEARADLVAGAVSLAFEASDTSGLVGALAGREVPAARMHLALAGPVSRLVAELDLAAQGLIVAEARGTLALDGPPAVDLRVSIRPEPGALPETYASLLGEKLGLELVARAEGESAFVLERLHLESAFARAEGAGRIDLAKVAVSGAVELSVPDLSALRPLAGLDLAGRIALRAQADEENRDRIHLALHARGLQVAAFAVAALDGAFDLGLQRAETGLASIDVEGGVDLQAVAIAGEPLVPDPDLRVELAGSLPARGPIAIRRLEVRGTSLRLAADGTLAPDFGGGHFERVVLQAPDLTLLARRLKSLWPAGPDLAGSAELSGSLEARDGWRDIEGPLTLALSHLHTPDPLLAAVLGDAPRLSATFRYGSEIALSDIDLALAALAVRGALSLRLSDDALSGSLDLAATDVAPIAKAAGVQASGPLTARLELAGTLAAPALALVARLEPLDLSGLRFDAVRLDLDAKGGLHGLAGRIALGLLRDDAPLSLDSPWSLAGGRLELERLRLQGPGGAEGSGRLVLDTTTLLASGTLELRAVDLAALDPWTQAGLSGRMDLVVELVTAKARQDAVIRASLVDLAGPFGRLTRAGLDLTLRDAAETRRLSADLEAAGFAREGLGVEEARVHVEGTLERLAFDLKAQGATDRPFALEASGNGGLSGEVLRMRIERLQGTYDGRRMVLARPLEAELADGVLRIPEIDVRIEEKTQIRGSLERRPQRLALELDVFRLPLALAAEFGAPDLAGTADLHLRLDGPPAGPRGELVMQLRGLRPADPLLSDLPPADVDLTARLGQGRLSLAAQAVRGGATTLVAELALPLRLDLARGTLDLPDGGGLSGRIRAEAALSTLATLAGLDHLLARGTLAADLALAGTVGSPELDGTVRIVGARIEEGRTGLVLDRLELLVRARGRELVVERLAARDGNGGRLSGSGRINLADLIHPEYDLTLNARDFRTVATDSALVVLDADIDIVGDVAAAGVSGRVRVDRAEFRIGADLGAPDVPVLAVEERGTGGTVRVPAVRPEAGPAFRLVHDLVIEAPGRVHVRGFGLESEWGGRLRIVGTTPDLAIEGGFGLRRGTLDLLGQRLTLARGTVTFYGSLPPQPVLDVEATAERESVKIRVLLEGAASRPRLTLVSEPELPQDEILARLLFGTSRDVLKPTQALRLAAALRELESGGFGLLGGLREALGVDVLDLGTDESGGASVAAGKYLSNEVYLQVERSLATGETKGRIEVEITPNVSFGAEAGSEGTSGVELEWRFDY